VFKEVYFGLSVHTQATCGAAWGSLGLFGAYGPSFQSLGFEAFVDRRTKSVQDNCFRSRAVLAGVVAVHDMKSARVLGLGVIDHVSKSSRCMGISIDMQSGVEL